MNITDYCADFDPSVFGTGDDTMPWVIIEHLEDIIAELLTSLDDEYVTADNVAIHPTARVDDSAQIHGPAIIGPDCFVGPHALIRGGVLLGRGASVGPGCEVKRSIVGKGSALAHFNFVGDSILGVNVNLEAGAILANHYNEREDKTIYARIDGEKVDTGVRKFGALVGDNSKVGANAVTSPGTLLKGNTVVGRLELVEQNP